MANFSIEKRTTRARTVNMAIVVPEIHMCAQTDLKVGQWVIELGQVMSVLHRPVTCLARLVFSFPYFNVRLRILTIN